WIFNLAAQSHVGTSFDQPLYTMNVTCLGHLNLLESVRLCKPDTRIYFAGSSEEFGSAYEIDPLLNKYQYIGTPKLPCSPYGVAKTAAHQLSEVYREGYGLDIRVGV